MSSHGLKSIDDLQCELQENSRDKTYVCFDDFDETDFLVWKSLVLSYQQLGTLLFYKNRAYYERVWCAACPVSCVPWQVESKDIM
jgi:hypothetical protein